jgi:molybdenum cofactor biosynthesis enzyme MoaA
MEMLQSLKGVIMEQELKLIITRARNYECYFCHGEGVEKNCKTLLNADDYKFLVGQCKKMFG